MVNTFTADTGHKKNKMVIAEQTTMKDAFILCLKIKKYCAENNIFYLKLDIDVPDKMLQEAMELREIGYYVLRKYSLGFRWYSSTVYGKKWYEPLISDAKHRLNDIHHLANEENADAFIEAVRKNLQTNNLLSSVWTDVAEHCPITVDWLKHKLPNDNNYIRCRFMLLDGGGYIRTHTDNEDKRPRLENIFSSLNIALSQPNECYLRRTDTNEKVPFEAGSAYLFDNGVLHDAANNSEEPRYHFLVNGGEWCLDRLNLYIRSFIKQHPNATIT